MRYLAHGAVVLVLLASLALAGDDAAPVKNLASFEKELDELARRSDPRKMAWSAYLAATHQPSAGRSKAWISFLESAIATRGPSGKNEDVRLVRAILDAFIQRGARPTAQNLARCIRRHPSEVIVLCSQDPKRYEAVLRAMLGSRLHDIQWMAIANLLRTRKTPGAMFAVLRGANTKLEVSVLVDKNSAIGVGGGMPGAPRRRAVGHGFVKIPQGWPPAVEYHLADFVYRGWVVLASGSHPVVYKRHEFTGGARTTYSPSIARNAFRYHVLADCLGWPFHELRVEQFAHKVIYWKDEAHYIDEVAKKRYFLRLFWDGEMDTLVREGYLTKAEAAELELDVTIESEWMGWGKKRELPDVPEGILDQEKERRKRKRDLTR